VIYLANYCIIGEVTHSGLKSTKVLRCAVSTDAGGKATQTILYYMDFHQPIYYEFPLPEGVYTAELVDPWTGAITAVQGTHSGKTKLKLVAKPYQALRFRRVGTANVKA
jgi:hypothetical protein